MIKALNGRLLNTIRPDLPQGSGSHFKNALKKIIKRSTDLKINDVLTF